jgi:hypothetical protein
MPRPRSDKTAQAKSRLVARIRDGLHRPGDRFLSNRAIAAQYGLSYQTAHRLIGELCREGLLVRRAASGTYLPGGRAAPLAARLVFHRRGRRRDSFGARLLRELTTRLDREGIAWSITWMGGDRPAPVRTPRRAIPDSTFPVIWECQAAVGWCVEQRRAGLLLNQRPPSGIASTFLDSVSTDDFSGGVCAAQVLQQRTGKSDGFAVLSGPADDPRSMARTAGFQSLLKAQVIASRNWFFDGGWEQGGRVVQAGPNGVFCCNDRLAEAVVRWCRQHDIPLPPIVGFDGAPVSERLNLSTIAIPWAEIVAGAVGVIRRRLTADPTTASRQIFAPRPIIRG